MQQPNGTTATVTSTTGTAPLTIGPGNDAATVYLTFEDGSSQIYHVADFARALVRATGVQP